MSRLSRRNVQFSRLLIVAMFASSGCAERTRVFIETDFLGEPPARIDASYVDRHYPELLYLCQTGNREAITVGVAAMGHERGIFSVDQDYSIIARAIYETDFDVFWTAFSHLDATEQARIVAGLDELSPLDWAGVGGERERHVSAGR